MHFMNEAGGSYDFMRGTRLDPRAARVGLRAEEVSRFTPPPSPVSLSPLPPAARCFYDRSPSYEY